MSIQTPWLVPEALGLWHPAPLPRLQRGLTCDQSARDEPLQRAGAPGGLRVAQRLQKASGGSWERPLCPWERVAHDQGQSAEIPPLHALRTRSLQRAPFPPAWPGAWRRAPGRALRTQCVHDSPTGELSLRPHVDRGGCVCLRACASLWPIPGGCPASPGQIPTGGQAHPVWLDAVPTLSQRPHSWAAPGERNPNLRAIERQPAVAPALSQQTAPSGTADPPPPSPQGTLSSRGPRPARLLG